jgi:hypothetical protein
MNKEAEKFLQTERDLAALKIKMLGSGKDLLKKRLLDIEKEFLSLNFDQLETYNDVASAVGIYRKSRREFFEKYPHIKSKSLDPYSVQKIKDYFIKEIDKINPIHNTKVYELYSDNVEEDISNKDINQLLLEEPIKVARIRARMQICLYAISILIEKDAANITRENLEYIFKYIDENAYKYYNEAVDKADKIQTSEYSANKFITKMSKLDNILPIDASVNTYEKYYGIKLNIPRVGNEKLKAIYFDLRFENDGVGYKKKISNAKIDGTYEYLVKCIDNNAAHTKVYGEIIAPLSRREQEAFEFITPAIKNIILDAELYFRDLGI